MVRKKTYLMPVSFKGGTSLDYAPIFYGHGNPNFLSLSDTISV